MQKSLQMFLQAGELCSMRIKGEVVVELELELELEPSAQEEEEEGEEDETEKEDWREKGMAKAS